MVELLDHAVSFSQVSHTILSLHRECRPSDLRIPRMVVSKGVDEADNTSR